MEKMSINFNEIDIKILNFLLHGETYSLQEILREFSYSKSLIKKSLSKLDETLREKGFPSLRIERGVYSITTHKKEIIHLIKENIKYSKDERITHLLFNILTQGQINLTRIAEELGYNRKTLQLDLRTCKDILKVFNLSLESHHGKYIKLHGEHRFTYVFLIALLVKIILKRKIPAYESLYKTLFPKDKVKKYRDYFYEIDQIFPYILGFKRYCGIVSIFAIQENFPHLAPKNFFSSFTPKEKIFIDKYSAKLENLNIRLIKDNVTILSYLLSEVDHGFYEDPLKISSSTKKFIYTFETLYYTLTPKNRMILHTLIKDSIFEKAFNLLENPDIGSYLHIEEKDDFNISIKTILKNCKIDISHRSYLKIIMFLNSIRNDNLKIEKNSIENILILDTSLDFWMGNIIKSHLYRNYNLKKIDLKHFLENIKYETYDLVFTLDLPRDRYPKVDTTLIPIDWIEFGVNKDYFNRFPFKHL